MPDTPHNIYSGADFNVPDTPQAIAPGLGSSLQDLSSGSQAVADNIADLAEDTYDRMEYTLDTQHKEYLARTRQDIENENTRRFSLPNGHADGFYDLNGAFRDSAYKAYKATQLKRFDGLALGYIRAESKASAQEDVFKIKASISASLDTQMGMSLAPRARQATLSLAKAQEEGGHYDLAAATIAGAPNYAFPEYEKAAEIARINREKICADIEGYVISGDSESYLRAVSDPVLMAKLTPDQRKKVYALQRSLAAETSYSDRQTPLPGSDDSSGSPAPTSGKTSHLGLPMGVPDELVQLFDRWDLGADKNARNNAEMQREARKALSAYAASFVTPDLPLEDEHHFISVAEQFGIDKSTAQDILEHYKKALRPTKGFNLEKALKAYSRFMSPTALTGGIRANNINLTNAIAAGNLEEAEALRAAIKVQQEKLNAFQKTVNDRSIARFSEWLQTQDAATLSDADRTMALMSIIDEEIKKAGQELNVGITGNDFIRNSEEYQQAAREQQRLEHAEESARQNRAELDRDVAETDRARLQAAELAADQALLEDSRNSTPLPAGARYATTTISLFGAGNLPDSYSGSYIAVPKGDALAGRTIAFKHNGRTHVFECRAADVSSPTLSVRAQGSLGLLGSTSTWSLAYDREGRAYFSNSTPPQTDFNMYRVIMREEARRDKNGRLMVYNLPAGDGGGDYEIAGINSKYHAAEAAKLRNMIESGAPDEQIENEVMSYYSKITQGGADLVSSSTKSRGIQLFMRDCALNHGNEGAVKVLRKALGISRTDNISTAVHDYVTKYGEKALLDALITGREQHYRDIAAANPAKRRFLNGWLNNRLRDIATASYAALNQYDQ